MLIGNSRRWLLAAAVFPLVLAGCASQGAGTGTAGTPAGPRTAASGSHRGLSAVRHVWVIELENQGYQQSFGTPSADPYLARILPRMGALLENYYAIGHASADNYIAEISGQAPSLGTQADCPVWIPFPGNAAAGPYHQVLGEGCVYPAQVQTLGNQLSGAGCSRTGSSPGGTRPPPATPGPFSPPRSARSSGADRLLRRGRQVPDRAGAAHR